MVTAMCIISVVSFLATAGILTLKVTAGVSAYNAISDMLDINNIGNFKNFDQPVTDLITQCILMLGRFVDYVQIIVCVCAFLCIIFNSFKLWAGTTEVKKAFVDMIYKCVMVMALVLIWPTIVTHTYMLATEIGVEASGGSEALVNAFASVAGHTQEVFNEGMKDYMTVLTKGAQKDSNGKWIVSDSALKAFMDAGMTADEARQWLANNNIKIDNSVTDKSSYKQYKLFSQERQDAKVRRKKQIQAEKEANKAFDSASDIEVDMGEGQTIFIDSSSRQAYIKQNIVVLRSMAEILTGIPGNAVGNVDINKILSMGDNSLKSVFYNPYVDGSTNRLSISTMMKTAIILSKACADGSMAPFEDYSKYDDEATQRTIDDYFEGQSLPFVVKIIGKIAIFFAYNLGMVICTGLLMIEYAMAMIEFLLVGAISTLLIPFFFIDATKQFVSNLIRMIFNYFVKILVTTTMVFFVMGMYLNMAETMYTRILSDSTTVLYYVFVLVLGIILSKNSGKVASAVVSGNPSLGLGDIANQMRGMTHAMHSIEHTVEKTSRQMQAAAGAGKKMGNTLATAGAANDSILDGKEAASLHTTDKLKANRMEMLGGSNSYAGKLQAKADAGEQLSESEMYDLTNAQQEAGARFGTDLSDKAIDNAAKQAGKDYEKQARSQFRNDWMFNKMTGLERPAENAGGALRVGQTFKDKEGHYRQATLADVAEAGKIRGKSFDSQGINNSNAALERYRNQKPDSDISAKELNERQQKKMPSWPEPEL